MADLKDPRLIYFKGLLFLLTGSFAAGLLLFYSPSLTVAVLLAICVWCFCRFYYFAFYVIQHYVDDRYRFAGLWSFCQYVWHKRFGWRPPPDER